MSYLVLLALTVVVVGIVWDPLAKASGDKGVNSFSEVIRTERAKGGPR